LHIVAVAIAAAVVGAVIGGNDVGCIAGDEDGETKKAYDAGNGVDGEDDDEDEGDNSESST
jgi:hypothetical protein